MIKRLVRDKRLNVLGERLNEEPQYQNDNNRLNQNHCSTFIEIDIKRSYDYYAKFFLVPAFY